MVHRTRPGARTAAAALAAALAACGSGASPGPSPGGSGSTGPASASPSGSGGLAADVTRTDVGAPPVGLAFAGGAVWVAVAGANRLARVDPATGSVQGTVAVGDTPLRLVATPAGVWVSEFRAGSVVLVDPARRAVVRRVTVGDQPEGLATDGSHLWVVLQAQARLVELDVRTGARLRTVALPAGGEPRLAVYAPAAAGRAATVWVNDFGGDRMVPVDAATGRVQAPVGACAGPQAMAVGGDTLWVACLSGALVGVDLATHQVTAAVQLGSDPDAVALTGTAAGQVWVALSTGPALALVDAATRAVTGRWKLAETGPLPNADADVDVVVAGAQVWVSSWNGQDVLHVPVGSLRRSP